MNWLTCAVISPGVSTSRPTAFSGMYSWPPAYVVALTSPYGSSLIRKCSANAVTNSLFELNPNVLA